MDPYGLLRKRVQSSRGRFWTWLDHLSDTRHEPVPPPPELEAEGLLIQDRNAWIELRPLGWRGSLPINRGQFGLVALTHERLLIGLKNADPICIAVLSESFLKIRLILTGGSSLHLDLIPSDGPDPDKPTPRRVSISSAHAHEIALAITAAQSNRNRAPTAVPARDSKEYAQG